MPHFEIYSDFFSPIGVCSDATPDEVLAWVQERKGKWGSWRLAPDLWFRDMQMADPSDLKSISIPKMTPSPQPCPDNASRTHYILSNSPPRKKAGT